MKYPTVIIEAPGMQFEITPQDQYDIELVRVAARDAVRRTRKAMKFSLPSPQTIQRGEEQDA